MFRHENGEKIMKKHLWTICFSTCLFAFTLYVLLDTFVITRAWQTDITAIDTSFIQSAVPTDFVSTDDDIQAESSDIPLISAGTVNTIESVQTDNPAPKPASYRPGSRKKKRSETAEPSENSITETVSASGTAAGNSYDDGHIKISVQTYEVEGTAVYVADVQLSSIEYLKTAFAYDTYGKNVTAKTSEIASAHNAILAINGDYYGAQEKGYVIRNGILFRDTAGNSEVLCINADGSLNIVKPGTVTAEELLEQGVWQAFSFGPALVADGEIAVSEKTEVGRAKASNPRTAIGIIDDLHYVFVVSDGRTDESEGLSLYELAGFLQQIGVKTAYNLDGGGSSTMVFNGEIINNPTTSGSSIKERSISDIIYIG